MFMVHFYVFVPLVFTDLVLYFVTSCQILFFFPDILRFHFGTRTSLAQSKQLAYKVNLLAPKSESLPHSIRILHETVTVLITRNVLKQFYNDPRQQTM